MLLLKILFHKSDNRAQYTPCGSNADLCELPVQILLQLLLT